MKEFTYEHLEGLETPEGEYIIGGASWKHSFTSLICSERSIGELIIRRADNGFMWSWSLLLGESPEESRLICFWGDKFKTLEDTARSALAFQVKQVITTYAGKKYTWYGWREQSGCTRWSTLIGPKQLAEVFGPLNGNAEDPDYFVFKADYKELRGLTTLIAGSNARIHGEAATAEDAMIACFARPREIVAAIRHLAGAADIRKALQKLAET